MLICASAPRPEQ